MEIHAGELSVSEVYMLHKLAGRVTVVLEDIPFTRQTLHARPPCAPPIPLGSASGSLPCTRSHGNRWLSRIFDMNSWPAPYRQRNRPGATARGFQRHLRRFWRWFCQCHCQAQPLGEPVHFPRASLRGSRRAAATSVARQLVREFTTRVPPGFSYACTKG